VSIYGLKVIRPETTGTFTASNYFEDRYGKFLGEVITVIYCIGLFLLRSALFATSVLCFAYALGGGK
jgi:Na+/proline symporter